jgi:hypothetical protein
MHKILTDKERELLKRFIENSEKGKGFRLLKLRILREYPKLIADLELMKKAIKHF